MPTRILAALPPGRRPSQSGDHQGDDVNLDSILIGSADPQRLADYYTRLFGTLFCKVSGYTRRYTHPGIVTAGPPV